MCRGVAFGLNMTTISLTKYNEESPQKIDVEKVDSTEYLIRIEDKSYSLSFCLYSSNHGIAVDLATNQTIPFYFYQSEDSLEVWILGKNYKFNLFKESLERKAVSRKDAGLFTGIIKAPMPGTILKILVEAGSKVSLSDPLIIMESMKMEMTISAPKKGTIAYINCKVGQLVEMNSELVKLDTDTNE